MNLLALDATVIRALAPPGLVFDWVREAMLQTSHGEVALPLRQRFELPGGRGGIGVMPGYVGSLQRAGVKLASLVPAAKRKGSSHLGLLILYDSDGLVPVALLEAGTVTALRTAAASAVATDVLARADADCLAILGAGEQADAHLDALIDLRPFGEVRIWSRTAQGRANFIARNEARTGIPIRAVRTPAEAARGADVICTVTSAQEPFLSSGMIDRGCHVNLVGSSNRQAQEIDCGIVAASRFFVDYRQSAFEQAAELIEALDLGLVTKAAVAGEIGEVLSGATEGRQSKDQITVYKSLGVASQDIFTADHLFERAKQANAGIPVTFAT